MTNTPNSTSQTFLSLNPDALEARVREFVHRLEVEESERLLSSLPPSYVARFRDVAFFDDHPVIFLSPFDVPIGLTRKTWMDCHDSFREKGQLNSMPYLVYQYDAAEDHFLLACPDDLEDYASGLARGCGKVTKRIENSSSGKDKVLLRRLRIFHADAEKPKEERCRFPDIKVSLGVAEDGTVQVGDRLGVYWPGERQYFPGVVADRGECIKMLYDDGDVEWIRLSENAYYNIDAATSTTSGGPQDAAATSAASSNAILSSKSAEVNSSYSLKKDGWIKKIRGDTDVYVPAKIKEVNANNAIVQYEDKTNESLDLKRCAYRICADQHGRDGGEMARSAYRPSRTPRLLEDGTFARPIGRCPLGYVWDETSGMWVPLAKQKTAERPVKLPSKRAAIERGPTSSKKGKLTQPFFPNPRKLLSLPADPQEVLDILRDHKDEMLAELPATYKARFGKIFFNGNERHIPVQVVSPLEIVDAGQAKVWLASFRHLQGIGRLEELPCVVRRDFGTKALAHDLQIPVVSREAVVDSRYLISLEGGTDLGYPGSPRSIARNVETSECIFPHEEHALLYLRSNAELVDVLLVKPEPFDAFETEEEEPSDEDGVSEYDSDSTDEIRKAWSPRQHKKDKTCPTVGNYRHNGAPVGTTETLATEEAGGCAVMRPPMKPKIEYISSPCCEGNAPVTAFPVEGTVKDRVLALKARIEVDIERLAPVEISQHCLPLLKDLDAVQGISFDVLHETKISTVLGTLKPLLPSNTPARAFAKNLVAKWKLIWDAGLDIKLKQIVDSWLEAVSRGDAIDSSRPLTEFLLTVNVYDWRDDYPERFKLPSLMADTADLLIVAEKDSLDFRTLEALIYDSAVADEGVVNG